MTLGCGLFGSLTICLYVHLLLLTNLELFTDTSVGYHMYISIEKVLYMNEDLFGVFHMCGSDKTRDVKIRARVQQFLENFQTFSSMSFS
jgi:hypothetical protein